MILSEKIQQAARDLSLTPVYGETWQQNVTADNISYPALFLDLIEEQMDTLDADKVYNDVSFFIGYQSKINEMYSYYSEKIRQAKKDALQMLIKIEQLREDGAPLVKSIDNIRISEIQQITIYDLPLSGVTVQFNMTAHNYENRC